MLIIGVFYFYIIPLRPACLNAVDFYKPSYAIIDVDYIIAFLKLYERIKR